MDNFSFIESEVKNNYSNYDVEHEDPWHHEVEKVIRPIVLRLLERETNEKSVVLNAGSGGETYPCQGKIINLDIVDTNIKQFEDYIVSSITNIPLKEESVDIVICVGSVINYADVTKALSEFLGF